MKIIERVYDIQTEEITDIEREATPQEIAEMAKFAEEQKTKLNNETKIRNQKLALLEKLGITEEEAKLLLS